MVGDKLAPLGGFGDRQVQAGQATDCSCLARLGQTVTLGRGRLKLPA